MASDSEVEGTYRFLNNTQITPEQILAPHQARTVERCMAHNEIWVVHDMTSLAFGGDTRRDGLGLVKGKKQGFDAQFTIAVERGASRQMLGVLELQRFNDVPKKKRAASRKPVRAAGELDPWQQGVKSTLELLGSDGPRQVHLMDRGADSFGVWGFLYENNQDFVIRLQHDRKLSEETKLFEQLKAMQQETAIVERIVPIARRGKESGSTLRKIHPPRDSRTAHLEIRACAVVVPRPRYADDSDPSTLDVNIVEVVERNAPEGCTPVNWKLVTSLPIATPEQVDHIVDAYRARWTVEEYFKALKTGCKVQERQLDSYEALAMMLALMAPVAWRLLQLRSLARSQPNAPASDVLTPTQLQVLQRKARDPMPPNPTVADALFAVARLGGFLKHNKVPGWQVIARGFHDLLLMEEGWISALSESRCDQ